MQFLTTISILAMALACSQAAPARNGHQTMDKTLILIDEHSTPHVYEEKMYATEKAGVHLPFPQVYRGRKDSMYEDPPEEGDPPDEGDPDEMRHNKSYYPQVYRGRKDSMYEDPPEEGDPPEDGDPDEMRHVKSYYPQVYRGRKDSMYEDPPEEGDPPEDGDPDEMRHVKSHHPQAHKGLKGLKYHGAPEDDCNDEIRVGDWVLSRHGHH